MLKIKARLKTGFVVKDYQEVRANLIDMLEDLELSLEDIIEEEKFFENQTDKGCIEIEKALLSDRFSTKPGKTGSN